MLPQSGHTSNSFASAEDIKIDNKCTFFNTRMWGLGHQVLISFSLGFILIFFRIQWLGFSECLNLGSKWRCLVSGVWCPAKLNVLAPVLSPCKIEYQTEVEISEVEGRVNVWQLYLMHTVNASSPVGNIHRSVPRPTHTPTSQLS